ncbi:CMP-N-acetylneuraminate-beta-1,4-galactoside alpha-2,3-sialyltransferase [Labeo rohita]|uniref:CMP-N-acetylneuraminate-beta-1,4-galactoside alpha-2,3-sialyltransferase n=1 Tax=Labeo rohita TaxID=84645 RepID=A0ABQ8MK19_LABRO|nr:CMP-N-acetylneuraminate-beta-1,4-galactoside alpha-2,3-sialyltransferase [Labeo rohita]
MVCPKDPAGEVGVPGGERELCVRTCSWLQLFASVSPFILDIKASGVFTQLRALFSGRERLFCRSMEGFWKSVARFVPRGPEDIRILNPYFIQEAAFKFIGLPHNNGVMGKGHAGGVSGAGLVRRVSLCGDKTFTLRLVSPASVDQNIPTLGTVAITMALHNCDEVAVAGFGYDMSNPHAPLHYYEKLMMSAIKEVTAPH